MLSLTVLGEESYDEEKNKFLLLGGYNLELEHSLVALSKWESKFTKPFLTEEPKTAEETFEYIKAMAIHPRIPDEVFLGLNESHLKLINEYMNAPMTATWFNETRPSRPSTKVITNELIYYWMSGLQLPVEMENWHLNRLFTALKVANIESQPPKKMSQAEVYADMRRKNEERRKQYEANS